MKQYSLEIKSNGPIARDTREMVCAAPPELCRAFMPGQFAHLKAPGRPDLPLRRPISIMRCQDGEISFAYAVKGEGTRALAAAEPGVRVDALAPLGRPFPEISGKIWLLGGGVGVAPLLPVALSAPGCTAFLGFADRARAFGYDAFARSCVEVNVFTDDGSLGQRGFAISGLLERLRYETPAAIFACGPPPMLRALSNARPAAPCFVSMEQRMGCGIGACMTCVCKIKTGDGFDYRRVCADGPVFRLEDIIYD